MSYRQSSYKRPAWIGIGVAVALLVWFFGPALSDAAKRVRLSRPAAFEAEMMSDPDAGELFKTIKVTNPDELRAFVQTGANKMREGASTEEMRAYTRQFMISILREQPRQISLAPHDDLVAAVTAQSQMFEKVRATDVAACAKMAATGSGEGAPASLKPAILAAAMTRLRVAAAGRDHPQAGPVKVTADDGRALVALMRKDGLSEGDATLFMTSINPASAPPQSLCDITYHSYRAALELPRDQGDRVMRWLIGP
jgi:hypothetical protein